MTPTTTLEAQKCIYWELENTAQKDLMPIGLDHNSEEIEHFVSAVTHRLPEAVDKTRGLVLQLDGLSALFQEDYANVRQTVLLPIERSLEVPDGLEATTLPAVKVLSFDVPEGEIGERFGQHLREAKEIHDPQTGPRIGDFARLVFKEGPNGVKGSIYIELLDPIESPE